MNHPTYMQTLEDLGDAPLLQSSCDILLSNVCRAPCKVHCEIIYGLQLLIFMVCQKAFFFFLFLNKELNECSSIYSLFFGEVLFF